MIGQRALFPEMCGVTLETVIQRSRGGIAESAVHVLSQHFLFGICLGYPGKLVYGTHSTQWRYVSLGSLVFD